MTNTLLLPAQRVSPSNSLLDIVSTWPARGSRPALGFRTEFGTRWWSYAELHREVLLAAARLERGGVGPRDRVAIFGRNSPEWVATLFAVWLRNAVAVPIDRAASTEFVSSCLERSDARWLALGTDVDEAQFAGLSVCVLPMVQGSSPATSDAPRAPTHDCRGSDPAVQLFTSGTTSASKVVTLSHANLLAQASAHGGFERLLRWLPVRILALSPLSHSQGLVMGALIPLSIGLSVIHSARLEPIHVVRTIREEQATLLLAVPGLQHALIEYLRVLPSGRGSRTVADEQATNNFFLRRHRLFLATRRHLGWRFAVLFVGGAALALADERFWFDCGYVLVQGYGLTETAAIVSYAVGNPFRWRGGSIGRALPFLETAIAPDGELLVRGPAVADSERSADGYLHTGDLVERDPAGRLRFVGRGKDLIVTAEGENVSPLRVEQALQSVAGVRDAVVLGVQRASSDRVHAVLLLDSATDAARAVAQANARLEPWERIASWQCWSGNDFPRGALGKIKRHVVRDVVDVDRALLDRARIETEPPAAPPALSLDEISALSSNEERVAALARHIASNGQGQPLAAEVLAARFGLKSLDVMALMTQLERLTGRALAPAGLPPSVPSSGVPFLVVDHDPAAGVSPAWASARPIQAVRRLLTPWLLPHVWRRFAELEVTGVEHVLSVRGPFILAALPHEHGGDVLLVQAALPAALRARLMFVGSAWTFREAFEPQTPLSRRLLIKGALKGLIPCVMPFVLMPRTGSSRECLLAVSRLVRAGYSPIIFPQGTPRDPKGPHMGFDLRPGLSLIAEATGATVIPVALWGNEGFSFRKEGTRPRMYVHFAPPVQDTAGFSAQTISERLAEAFERLRVRGYGPPAASASELSAAPSGLPLG